MYLIFRCRKISGMSYFIELNIWVHSTSNKPFPLHHKCTDYVHNLRINSVVLFWFFVCNELFCLSFSLRELNILVLWTSQCVFCFSLIFWILSGPNKVWSDRLSECSLLLWSEQRNWSGFHHKRLKNRHTETVWG